MALANARNRLIYFRVSEEELERFRNLAEIKGARSLSDLAREAIEKLNGNRLEASTVPAETIPTLLARIEDLRDSIHRMQNRLEELSLRLEAE